MSNQLGVSYATEKCIANITYRSHKSLMTCYYSERVSITCFVDYTTSVSVKTHLWGHVMIHFLSLQPSKHFIIFSDTDTQEKKETE